MYVCTYIRMVIAQHSTLTDSSSPAALVSVPTLPEYLTTLSQGITMSRELSLISHIAIVDPSSAFTTFSSHAHIDHPPGA
jgi:hypothetical protein